MYVLRSAYLEVSRPVFGISPKLSHLIPTSSPGNQVELFSLYRGGNCGSAGKITGPHSKDTVVPLEAMVKYESVPSPALPKSIRC